MKATINQYWKKYTANTLIVMIILGFSSLQFGCSGTIIISASESDAKIWVDGADRGVGNTGPIKVNKSSCVNIKVEKTGFLVEQTRVCHQSGGCMGIFKGPTTSYIHLRVDDAYQSSSKVDYANKEFDVIIHPELKEDEVWKRISIVALGFFDAIEKETKGTYLLTTYKQNSFTQNTIRTRMSVKISNTNPLTYKVKITSEYSGKSDTKINSNEQFKEWDRVLKAFNELIPEINLRLKNK